MSGRYVQCILFTLVVASILVLPCAADTSISLKAGWNFISIPLSHTNYQYPVDSLFFSVDTGGHSMWRYNAATQNWDSLNRMSSLSPQAGIWIYSVNPMDIPVVGDNSQIPTSKPLFSGWNMIGFAGPPAPVVQGFSTFSDKWIMYMGWNASSQQYDMTVFNDEISKNSPLTPGKGYWVYLNGPADYSLPPPGPTPVPTPTVITSVEMSGTGSNVAAFSATGTSQREFIIHYNGGSDFVVWLKDAQGNNVDLLVNTVGPYNGKISSPLTTGDYYLDILASGPWTILISPSVTQKNPTPISVPLLINGSGNQVVKFTATGSGLRMFSMNYNGGFEFIVWLKEVQSNTIESLVNTAGPYSGKSAARLVMGDYYLDVTASGPWSIEITSY